MIVTLIDINDNQPVFEPAKYQVSKRKPLKTALKHVYVNTTNNDITTNERLSCSNTNDDRMSNNLAVTKMEQLIPHKHLSMRSKRVLCPHNDNC